MKLIFSHTFWVFIAAGLCGAMLLHISQKVQQAETHLSSLEAQINDEQVTLRVLGAEWEYLNSPARLEVLSGEYLELVPAEDGVAAVSADDLPPMEIPTESALIGPEIVASPDVVSDEATFQPASYILPPKVKPSPPRSPAQRSLKPQKQFDDVLKNLGVQ